MESILYVNSKMGAYPISSGLKKGGLYGRAYPHTFSMGVPPPPLIAISGGAKNEYMYYHSKKVVCVCL